jgi:hypothetical protein
VGAGPPTMPAPDSAASATPRTGQPRARSRAARKAPDA